MPGPCPSPTEDQLATLFPPAVRWCFSNRPDDAGPLLAEELVVSESMSAVRLSSFRHGRHCAREALQKTGVGRPAIGRDEHRAPIWPDGIIASIAHCHDSALAAAARRSDLAGLGLDLEFCGELETDVEALICLPEELASLERLKDGDENSKLIFSAKEAVYKCLWPLLRRYIDFLDVRLALDPAKCRFSIHSARGLPADLTTQLTGRYLISETLILTSAYLDSSAGRD